MTMESAKRSVFAAGPSGSARAGSNRPIASIPTRRRGLLLVGHGTQDMAGQREFHALAGAVAESLAPCPAVACFLELAEPSIAAGIRQLVGAGVRHIVVAPALLFSAGHDQHDIPRAVEAALEANNDVTWSQTRPFACHDRLLETSAQRAAVALANLNGGLDAPQGDPVARREPALLVLIGRGSRDASAAAEMLRFSKRLAEQARLALLPIAETRVGFVAMAAPSMSEVFYAATNSPWKRVVVQPHLLFRGQLLDEIRREARAAAHRATHQHWALADHIGPDPALSRLVCELANRAFISGGGREVDPDRPL